MESSSWPFQSRSRSAARPSSSFPWTHSRRFSPEFIEVIRVEGLHKSFSDVHAVAGVDLHVERGEILVLLGQNGAGKSTTLRCLGGILRPDTGVIELDGLRVPDNLDAIRARLGVVPDQARLYGRNTATEYLDHFGFLYGVPPAVRRERIAHLLERFELADRRDTVLAAYSRGMAQKVALIRATLHEPDWIFCDEPTAGLDPVAAAEMRRYLGEQRERCAALIITTHILSEAELIADRIAIMRQGVIVTSGTPHELRRKAGGGRLYTAHLAHAPTDPEPVEGWLAEHALSHTFDGDRLTYALDWDAQPSERADFAAALQTRLAEQGAAFHELVETQPSLESVYLSAMSEPMAEPLPTLAARLPSGIGAGRLFASIRSQGRLLGHALPFYVSSWWRRGDLSWVMYLNAFVLLLVAGTSLFGQLPGPAGQVAARFAGGAALQAGLLLPPLLHVLRAARIDQELDRDLVGEGAGLSRGAALHAARRPLARMAGSAPRRGRERGLGDFLDGRGHGAPELLRRAGALGTAAGVRVRRGGHRVLGRDGSHARVHAVPARGRGGRRMVVPALAGLSRGRGRSARALRLSRAVRAGVSRPAHRGLPRADRDLRRDVRPRASDGDGRGPEAAACLVPAGNRPSQRRRDRRGRAAGGRAGRHRRDRERDGALDLLVGRPRIGGPAAGRSSAGLLAARSSTRALR
ncbi:MAG: ABC transporter ATP-binding protein [Chloroflexi bacterium]|nr:MAG: ABC transporter ATP-binding protein [Chloroflexota bacterium]